jgi:hypothetical protein
VCQNMAPCPVTFVTLKSGSASLPHSSEDDYTWSRVVQPDYYSTSSRAGN